LIAEERIAAETIREIPTTIATITDVFFISDLANIVNG